jgi:hypothetical protein
MEGAFALFDDMTWRSFLASCVAGSDHYLSAMPKELHVPRVLPELAKLALKIPTFGSKAPRRVSPQTSSQSATL